MFIELNSSDLDNIMKIVLQLAGKSGKLKDFRFSKDGRLRFKINWLSTVAVALEKISDYQLAVEITEFSRFWVKNWIFKRLYCFGNKIASWFGGGIKSKMPDFVEAVSDRRFVVDLDKLAGKFHLPVSFTLQDIVLRENGFSLRLDIEDSLVRYTRKSSDGFIDYGWYRLKK